MSKKSKVTDNPTNTEDCHVSVSPTAASRPSSANNTFVHISLIAFLILIVYSNTLDVPFQWDENMHIAKEPIIKDLHYFIHPSEARGFEHYNFFISRYIPHLTFALNFRMHGLSVTGYHVVNTVIHIGSAALVYLLVLLTFRTPFMSDSSLKQNSPYVALFSSLLFAAHPLQTGAVTYVMQRFASLVAFFYLLSLVFYIKARLALTTECTEGPLDLKKPKKFFLIAQSSSLWPLWLILSFISAVLAMKTKENAFTLPIVIALYELCFFNGGIKKRILLLGPILLTLCVIPLTVMSMTAATGKIGSSLVDPGSYVAGFTWDYSWEEYLFTQFRVIITYLRLLFFPVNLGIDYEYPVYRSFFHPQVMLSFIFLALLFGFGVYLVKQAGVKDKVKTESLLAVSHPQPALRLIGFGILWFFITLSVESIITTPRLIETYRVYLPSVGALISTVTGLFLLKEKMRSPKVRERILLSLVITVGVLSVATYLRNNAYGDKIGMWEEISKRFPSNPALHVMFGKVYRERNMIDKAIEQNLIAIKLNPDLAEAHNNLGTYYEDIGMFDKAIEQYLIAIKLKPDLADTHYNLGLAYYRMGRKESSRRELITVLKIKPDYQEARRLLNEISRSESPP